MSYILSYTGMIFLKGKLVAKHSFQLGVKRVEIEILNSVQVCLHIFCGCVVEARSVYCKFGCDIDLRVACLACLAYAQTLHTQKKKLNPNFKSVFLVIF